MDNFHLYYNDFRVMCVCVCDLNFGTAYSVIFSVSTWFWGKYMELNVFN